MEIVEHIDHLKRLRLRLLQGFLNILLQLLAIYPLEQSLRLLTRLLVVQRVNDRLSLDRSQMWALTRRWRLVLQERDLRLYPSVVPQER